MMKRVGLFYAIPIIFMDAILIIFMDEQVTHSHPPLPGESPGLIRFSHRR